MKNLKLQRQLLQKISSALGVRPRPGQEPLLCVLKLVAELGGYQSASLYLGANGDFTVRAHVGTESPVAAGADSQLAAAAQSGQPMVNHDESGIPTAVVGAKSQAVVPIRRGATTIGALVLSSRNPYAFGAGELAALKAVARRLAVYFATSGKHYVRNIRRLPKPDQTGAVTAAVA